MAHHAERSFPSQLLEQLPSLRRRAQNLCRNDADADDLVQDTMSRALSHAEQFELGTNLRAWLMRILYHCFATSHRSRKRERRAYQRFAFEPQHLESNFAVECATSLPTRILRALGELPSEMADVVTLVDLEEHSYREAAESLKVPVGTIMSRLYRGRQRLAVELCEGAEPMAKPVGLSVAA